MRTSLFDIENWREIGATLARNKTRTFLTAFGIFWGTAMLALLFGGASGFQGIMSRNFAGLTTNMAGVFSNTRKVSYKGFNKGSYWSMKIADIEAIRAQAPAMDHSSTMTSVQAKAAYGSKSKSGTAMGVESDYGVLNLPVMYEGRFLSEADVRNTAKVVVVGKNIAADLFGNEPAVGKDIELNGVFYRVIGVAGQLGEASIGNRMDDSFVIPSSTMRSIMNQSDNVGFFIYSAPAGHSPLENQEVIRRILSRNHYISPDDKDAIGFMDISEIFDMISKLFLGIKLLALFVGLGSLMAGIIGVGNIMWIVVKERTHEFGIRRAIGATPRDITVQVLSESIVLTLLAGIAGVCFAVGILAIMDRATADPNMGFAGFEISFDIAVGIVVAFFILGSLAGTLPAVKAMKIKPIEAINDK